MKPTDAITVVDLVAIFVQKSGIVAGRTPLVVPVQITFGVREYVIGDRLRLAVVAVVSAANNAASFTHVAGDIGGTVARYF